MVNFVIVGNIAFDINTYPKRNMGKDLIVVNNGGAGYYSLIPASIYTNTGIVARVGYDFDRDKLIDKNIDLLGLKVVENIMTTKFNHTYLSNDGQIRTFVPEIYEDTMIRESDFPKEYFGAKYIHVATNIPSMQKKFIEMIRKNSSAKISIDTHEAYISKEPELVREVFDMVDIAFIDKEYKELLECRSPIKIIKMGKQGCRYISDLKTFEVKPKLVVEEVIDKTGAGDVVTGVFMALLSEGKSEKIALEIAVGVATTSIKDYGVDFLKN